jgi:leader peptidase (prepilin peptidase)/N-methyltransferase
MLDLIIFIFGLFFGSFLGVLADRLPKDETVIKGRSHCDFCKKELRWFDLIPLLSFLATGGKCRYCKKRLPLFYPLIEIATGIVFVLALRFLAYPSTLALVIYLAILSLLIVVFFMDLKHGVILNNVLALEIIAVAIYLLLFNQSAILINIVCAVLAFGFFFATAWLFKLVRGKDGMGGGDIKLAFVLGLLLGFPDIIVCLYLAFLTGAITGIILVLWSKKSPEKTSLAFGPFLVFAAIIALLWGNFLFEKAALLLGI